MNTKKKTPKKALLPLILFSIVFFICMTFMIFSFWALAKSYDQRKLHTRLDYMQVNEKVIGPDATLRELMSESNYEPEFDEYWVFGNIRYAYVKARFGTDVDGAISKIENYLSKPQSDLHRATAEKYLETIKK